MSRDAGHRANPEKAFDAAAALDDVSRVMRGVRPPNGSASVADAPASDHRHVDAAAPSPDQLLAALALLREVRTHIAAWEPELIEAARAAGTSWADLAPALGVASRQAAERRYLRLRRSPDGAAGTADERVAAERDKRAGDKAVAGWARANAGDLRRLAGQIGALEDLGAGADSDLAALRRALGRDDAADLLAPLAEARAHLQADHPSLAEQVGEIGRSTDAVRAASDRARRAVQP